MNMDAKTYFLRAMESLDAAQDALRQRPDYPVRLGATPSPSQIITGKAIGEISQARADLISAFNLMQPECEYDAP